MLTQINPATSIDFPFEKEQVIGEITPIVNNIDPNSQNKFAKLPNNQEIMIIPEFELECGYVLKNAPVAYKTLGKLNETRDNVIVICHALSGSSDFEDWWGDLVGPGKPFDSNIFFIFCGNVLGSPYGSASPVTINPDTQRIYGPEFPLATIRDDVRIHRAVLDRLNVKSVEYVIGGSLGGMQALEWTYFGTEYVHNLVAIATCASQSAWGISWDEAQRQAIFNDPNFNYGYYTADNTPDSGLSTARMQAMMTYRTRDSFQARFGRKIMKTANSALHANNFIKHNEGNKNIRLNDPKQKSPLPHSAYNKQSIINQPVVYSAQSYLRYQGDKFVGRFDANCYVSITRKVDTHDISRDRADTVEEALAMIAQPTLVVGIGSDGLFTASEQEEIANNIPNSQLEWIESNDGHDAFLLEFKQMEDLLIKFMKERTPQYKNIGIVTEDNNYKKPMKASLFGEFEG
ncbi:homoserine O-acetyltransferase [Neocallimastix lanati (nom. inval.)]|jgi:homoserine O-acetyltransferase|uniref:Homoserine O-acetyltransferase n=1 Tax=Neocallimastix californiae TaxID=1754190 RepID=A0A1Y2E8G6_9FUNG|nr:homoserine O-acetyltransferase [Neocallimastix sp. JGI-2020a]ORY67858.1 homoserine O-acetyltransferase [Neocallimastix californiae]|eukprot:ORY67858.1 homoserine O-acetyltransferase [Neocallimastix californiae]